MADRYDLDRYRDRERDREFGGGGDRRHDERDSDRERGWRSGEQRWGDARHEDYEQRRGGGDEGWHEARDNGPEREADYGGRGDWGRQGSWGSYGNRAEVNRDNDWREQRARNWGYERSNFGGQRSRRTNLFGAGGGGFGTGFASYGAGVGPFGAGGYTGGMGAYGERERGRFAGRGPKGWQRSDERIREDINERLTDHPDIDASELEVTVNKCEVTLTGTVDERHAKRLAEDIAESVSGVREVHNQIRVQSNEGRTEGLVTPGGSSTGTTGRNR